MKIIVLSGYGLNCENETSFAFLQSAKHLKTDCECRIMHVSDLVDNPILLKEAQIFAIPGGFSFSDYSGAGNALAVILKSKLEEQIQDFISSGKLVIGICNGCQILTKLLPDFSQTKLKSNTSGKYICRWVNLKVNANNSPWLQNLNSLYLPIAHEEGRFVFNDSCDSIALTYAQTQENCTKYNPNGSQYDVAALTDKTGRVLAMMPHPERAFKFEQRPDWTMHFANKGSIPEYADGAQIFMNAIKYFI